MRICNEERFNPIFIFRSGSLFATTTTFLRTVFTQRLTLHITRVRKRDHHILRSNQIFCEQLSCIHFNKWTTTSITTSNTKLSLHFFQLRLNDLSDALWLSKQVEQIRNLCHHIFVLIHNLVLLKASQALQTHLQNFLCLAIRQTIEAGRLHAVLRQ